MAAMSAATGKRTVAAFSRACRYGNLGPRLGRFRPGDNSA